MIPNRVELLAAGCVVGAVLKFNVAIATVLTNGAMFGKRPR